MSDKSREYRLDRSEMLWMAAAALLAFGLRVWPLGLTISGDGFLFSQPDAWYHLRRAFIILNTFPRIPGIDGYMAFPFGAECPWPPLYDLAVAAISWLIGLGNPSARIVEGVASFLPPVLASLSIPPVYLMTRLVAGKGAARGAALLFAFAVMHMRYSMIGAGDHHTAEVFLLACFLYCHLRAIGREAEGFPDRGRYSFLAGCWLGAAVLVWQGSIVFSLLMAGGLFPGWLAARAGKDPGDSVRGLEVAFLSAMTASGVAAAIAAAGRLLYPSETVQTRFDFGFFSWFQPAFLLTVFAGILLLYAIHRRFPPRTGEGAESSGPVPVLGAILCVLAVPSAALLHPGFRKGVFEGVGFLMAGDPWLSSIVEFFPSFSWQSFKPPYSVDTLWLAGYLVAFILPMVLLPTLLIGRFRRREPLLACAVVTSAALGLGVLALIQRRWANAYSLPMAIGAGWALSLVHDRLKARSSPGSRIPAISAIAAGLFLAMQALLLIPGIALQPESNGYPGADPSLAWLRENTPPTSGLWGGATPEYAVFANWDLGHAIQYIARRPTIANNFGPQLRGNGMVDSAEIYLARDENRMAELCARRGIRYLMLRNVAAVIRNYAAMGGIDFDNAVFGRRPLPGEGTREQVNLAFSRLPFNLLYGLDGIATTDTPAMTRFRLIHEETVRDHDSPAGQETVKIFEFVRGARITGKTTPGREVILFFQFRTNQGRVVSYANPVTADGNGDYSARFPYSTTGTFYGMTPVGSAIVSTGSGEKSFEVTEKALLEGETVVVR